MKIKIVKVSEMLEKYLNESKMSIEDVKLVIENEGLGYAIQNYMSYNEIEDKKLASMWKKAAKILNNIEDYVGV